MNNLQDNTIDRWVELRTSWRKQDEPFSFRLGPDLENMAKPVGAEKAVERVVKNRMGLMFMDNHTSPGDYLSLAHIMGGMEKLLGITDECAKHHWPRYLMFLLNVDNKLGCITMSLMAFHESHSLVALLSGLGIPICMKFTVMNSIHKAPWSTLNRCITNDVLTPAIKYVFSSRSAVCMKSMLLWMIEQWYIPGIQMIGKECLPNEDFIPFRNLLVMSLSSKNYTNSIMIRLVCDDVINALALEAGGDAELIRAVKVVAEHYKEYNISNGQVTEWLEKDREDWKSDSALIAHSATLFGSMGWEGMRQFAKRHMD